MNSYPVNELPLGELLQFAAENQLTTSIELEGRLCTGRIDLRSGEVIDAHFGGLEREAAVHAALASPKLWMRKGRPPRSSAERRVTTPIWQLLDEGRRNLASRSGHGVGAPPAAGHVTPPRRRWVDAWRRRISRFRLLKAAIILGVLGAMGMLGWHIGVRRATYTSTVPSASDLAVGRSQKVEPPRLLTPSSLRITTNPEDEPFTLTVSVLVDENGTMVGGKIRDSRPDRVAAEDAALTRLFRSRFAPATRAEVPIIAWTDVAMSFQPALETARLEVTLR